MGFLPILGELWATRKLRLDLCLQLRLFERDALELSSQFELWGEQVRRNLSTYYWEFVRISLKTCSLDLVTSTILI